MGNMIDNRSDISEESSEDVKSEVETSSSEPSTEETSQESSESSAEETATPTKEPEEAVPSLKDANLKKEESVDSNDASTEKHSESEAPKPSRSSKRIQELLQKKKELEEILAHRSQATPDEKKEADDFFKPNENGEIEITKSQLEEFISKQVSTALDKEREVMTVQERVQKWDADIDSLMKEHPVLNPDSPEFNKDISEHLVDIIKTTNLDDNGNPTVKKLPSEIWAKLSPLLNLSKSEGRKQTEESLSEMRDVSAVHSDSQEESSGSKLSQKDILTIKKKDPRKYTEMVQRGEI